MADDKNSELAQKLELLKQRFKEKAVVDANHLCSALDRIREQGVASGELAAVYQSLHRLAGSAGTFGFPAFGEEARLLELSFKPLVDSARAAQISVPVDDVVDRSFVQRVHNLVALLDDEQASPQLSEVTSPKVRRAKPEEPLVLIVDTDQAQGQQLARDLQLHGFRTEVLADAASMPHAPDRDCSAIIVSDLSLMGESSTQAVKNIAAPVISIGSEDNFAERYRIAESGVDGFVCAPVEVPVLADYIERLIAEFDEGGSGRVMVVDDDAELLEHYSLVLERGGLEVRRVNDPSMILSELAEFRPDIVLMDVQMGRFSGPNLARMLRFDPEWLSLPIVYLSSEEDRDFQTDALSKGGDDFLMKPVSDAFLLRAVRVRCYRARQLHKLVSRDSLTGLLKHSIAKSEIQKAHSRSLRFGQAAAVAMLDLDHFKRVNDSYGHRTGDLVIKGLANLLRHRLRTSDIIGRYGGEEFVVALPDCSLEAAQDVLQSVCDQLSQIVFSSSGKEFSVTLSVGLAALGQFLTSDDAIEAADQALYQRKQEGRNGISVMQVKSEAAITKS